MLQFLSVDSTYLFVYQDVFPEELPGMPPRRPVEFVIELEPGTEPVCKRPYKLGPNELKV